MNIRFKALEIVPSITLFCFHFSLVDLTIWAYWEPFCDDRLSFWNGFVQFSLTFVKQWISLFCTIEIFAEKSLSFQTAVWMATEITTCASTDHEWIAFKLVKIVRKRKENQKSSWRTLVALCMMGACVHIKESVVDVVSRLKSNKNEITQNTWQTICHKRMYALSNVSGISPCTLGRSVRLWYNFFFSFNSVFSLLHKCIRPLIALACVFCGSSFPSICRKNQTLWHKCL